MNTSNQHPNALNEHEMLDMENTIDKVGYGESSEPLPSLTAAYPTYKKISLFNKMFTYSTIRQWCIYMVNRFTGVIYRHIQPSH